MQTMTETGEKMLVLPPTTRSLLGRIVSHDTPAGADTMQYREGVLERYGVTLREEITDAREREELINVAWAALPWQERV